VITRLLAVAADKIAAGLQGNAKRIRQAELCQAELARFTVNCEVEGTTVELDGAALGTAPGVFLAKPGLHQMRVTRQWFEPWERTVNIHDGQVLNIALEMSPAGIAQYKDLEGFKLARQIATDQSDADAYVKRTIAEGEAEKRKNSYMKFEGDIDSLSIGEGGAGDNTNNINIVPR